ncbi:MAG: hypothetical protein ACRDTC_10115, partial [Pseudonocardiaceae bacterium]
MGGVADRPVLQVLRAVGAIGAALAVLAGCGGGSQDMGHIHALGVDPGDGVLYAASHHGLFRIRPGSAPERVGTSSQDMMGFF